MSAPPPPPACRECGHPCTCSEPKPRAINATDLRLWIAQEDAAGNFDRANALRCALVWLGGGSYVVGGGRHE